MNQTIENPEEKRNSTSFALPRKNSATSQKPLKVKKRHAPGREQSDDCSH